MATGDSSEKELKKKNWNILGQNPAGCPVLLVPQRWECKQAPHLQRLWFGKKWSLGNTTKGPEECHPHSRKPKFPDLVFFFFSLSFAVSGVEAWALYRLDMNSTTQPTLLCW